ncbi:MAG: phosphodiester glycosidase family protein, partial [Bacteroidota bacterium]|nr:phosphodiester glycosidase family protein [Bacteroidota bacterium]
SDSLNVVKTKWENSKIARGIRLKHFWFNHDLFNSNENINILEVKMNRRNAVDVEADPKILKTTSQFGLEHDAVAALNGTFFDMKNGGSEDYIRMDGKSLNETHTAKNNKRALHQKSAVVIYKGRVSIKEWDGSERWEDELPGEDIMVTGPLLLKDHRPVSIDSVAFNTARHPRSAIAIKGRKLLLITVDGRNERAEGMSLFELAKVLKWLGADDAINLDGGGSTTLWVKGFPDGGVINHPSDNKAMLKSAEYKAGTDLDNMAADNKKWNHSGERPVANVILINKKK